MAPNPLTVTVSGEVGALLVMTKRAESAPAFVGVNRIVSLTDCPAPTFSDVALTLKAGLVEVMLLTMSPSVPVLVRVIVESLTVPTFTLPSETCRSFSLRPYVTPNPVTSTVSGELDAGLVMITRVVSSLGLLGANRMLSTDVCPAAIVKEFDLTANAGFVDRMFAVRFRFPVLETEMTESLNRPTFILPTEIFGFVSVSW